MEKFYRQDNMTIVLGPKPGKGVCLEFSSSDRINNPELVGNQRQVLKDIVAFIASNVQSMDAPLHKRVRASHPFIQGHNDDWLLIEFWSSDKQAIRDVCLLLAGKFDFDFEGILTVGMQSEVQMVYSYFSLRQWKIIHSALKHFTTNHRMIDQEIVSEAEIFDIRTKLPSASDA